VVPACSISARLLDSLSGLGCARAWSHGLGGAGYARPLVGAGYEALPHVWALLARVAGDLLLPGRPAAEAGSHHDHSLGSRAWRVCPHLRGALSIRDPGD